MRLIKRRGKNIIGELLEPIEQKERFLFCLYIGIDTLPHFTVST